VAQRTILSRIGARDFTTGVRTRSTLVEVAYEIERYGDRLVSALPSDEEIVPPPRSWVAKRSLDLLISVPVLLVMPLVFLPIMLAIYLDSGGPVLFRQVRVGKDGRRFVCYKFRTMRHVPGDQHDPVYVNIATKWMLGIPLDETSDDATHAQTEIPGKTRVAVTAVDSRPRCNQRVYKLKNDPRVTRVGRILRKTSLDELPQVLNVLRGEMSIVGPRPPTPYEFERYPERAVARLYVKPGITGVWQVKGRGRVSFDEMIDMDLDYVQNNSLVRDIIIIFSTIPAVVIGRGAA
jgi:lipopolysaccharide/colanic/teichoic acid biosynthesis glycosyltransferase